MKNSSFFFETLLFFTAILISIKWMSPAVDLQEISKEVQVEIEAQPLIYSWDLIPPEKNSLLQVGKQIKETEYTQIQTLSPYNEVYP